jgi:hypothetical protein
VVDVYEQGVQVGVHLGERGWHTWHKDQWGWDTSLCTYSGFYKGFAFTGKRNWTGWVRRNAAGHRDKALVCLG